MLDEANADARPAWFDYCDRPRLAGFKGRTHLRLAQPQAAHTVLEEAPDGGRARIATLAGCTASPASGRTSRACPADGASGSASVVAWSHRLMWTACRTTRAQ
jgi:hypothetical protein